MTQIGKLSKILDSVNDSSTLLLEYQFSVPSVENQTIAIFSENDSIGLSTEGNVVQKGECRSVVISSYLSLNKERIKKAAQPLRVVQQLDRAVVNFKPIAKHKSIIERIQNEKSGNKKCREDKVKVQDILFEAFERHQYYSLRDLEKITKQLIRYLRGNSTEILMRKIRTKICGN
jgi:transcription initiation factor TFIIF subunit beta